MLVSKYSISYFILFIFHFAVCFLLYLPQNLAGFFFSHLITMNYIPQNCRPHTNTQTTILELLNWFIVKLLNEAIINEVTPQNLTRLQFQTDSYTQIC